MAEVENDQESVESGSCTCSDYNPDSSWFYDSRKLQTSFMRFCILSDSIHILFKNKRARNIINENKLRQNNKLNEFKNESFINLTNRRKNVIKITKSSSTKNNNEGVKFNPNNKRKLKEINITKYSQRKKKNENLNTYNNENKTKNNSSSRQKEKNNSYSKNNSSSMLSEIKTKYKRTNFFPDNIKDYEHNYSAPIEKNIFNDKNINTHRSPVSFINKRINFFNFNKTEKKPEEKVKKFNLFKGYISPRMNIYKTFMKTNSNSVDNDEEKNHKKNDIKKPDKINKRNFQTRGRTIKEKVIKEVKNITLQPGQTIKPKTISKRKLKPHTSIIKNDDGTQSIITENTFLTTVTVNEILDSSKMYKDEYPLDVQVVKQYITKIYKTEIENNPYRQKKGIK